MTRTQPPSPSRRSGPGANLTETDIAQRRMGDNQLQGNDQEDVRNQRHAVPDVKPDAEGVVESFENMDPAVRARRENQP